MNQRIDAIYENGLLRPLIPLNLAEQQKVVLTVESNADSDWLDHDAVKWAEAEGDPSISLEEVRSRLAKIRGSLADVIIAERGEY